ncbi:MAG: hypothetical protein AAFN91_10315 [Pseudomonadota bacterium]
MTAQSNRPQFRVSFSRITGQDEAGQDKLGKAREIGAIWPRKDSSKGSILKLDLIPIELTNHQGVLFVTPVDGREGA